MAWVELFQLASRGMKARVKLRYGAQHGRWYWGQKKERDTEASVSLGTPELTGKVYPNVARELANKAQSLYQFVRYRSM